MALHSLERATLLEIAILDILCAIMVCMKRNPCFGCCLAVVFISRLLWSIAIVDLSPHFFAGAIHWKRTRFVRSLLALWWDWVIFTTRGLSTAFVLPLFVLVLGCETRQSAHFWIGLDKARRFWISGPIGECLLKERYSVWYFSIYGSRSVLWRCCAQEWCVVTGY